MSSADVILGQDFMHASGTVLDYGAGRLTIRKPKYVSFSVDAGHMTGHVDTEKKTERDCNLSPGRREQSEQVLQAGTSKPRQMEVVSAATAYHMLLRGHEAFVAFIQPDCNPAPELSHVPPEHMEALSTLLHKYQDVFCENLPPGSSAIQDPAENTIPLEPGSKPPFRKSFRLSPAELAELKKQIREFLERGWIQPSTSPYGAPVLFVKKKDGTLRCCIDYRQLNKITVKNRYPLPRIDDLLDQVAGHRWFSTLDLASGYYQIKLSPEDVPKTAFSTPWAHYEWKVLVMGLTNAPATFMAAMNKVFAPMQGKVLVYLDDVMIMGQTPSELLENMEGVFKILREHGLYAKRSKCEFFKPQVNFLGHVLDSNGITPDPRKVRSLHEWEYPKDGKGMLRFLGLANYFRKFIPNFSLTAAPLYHLTKKNVKYDNGPALQACFEKVKQALVQPPVLAYPDPTKPYELISDASVMGCGAILVQEGRPVAYYSAKFSSAERNYTTGEQELLGIIKALKEWRCYLEGCVGLTLLTDHNPLVHLPSQALLSRRQARWVEFMSRFHFTVKHRPGNGNPADPLSRIYSPELAATVNIAEFEPDTVQRIREGYAKESQFTNEKWTRKFTQEHSLWFYQGRIVIPACCRQEMIKLHHSNQVYGHFGVQRTIDQIGRHYWWPTMKKDVEHFIQHCHECQTNKSTNQKPYGQLQPLEMPDKRWDTVTMDFVTDLPKSSGKFDSILVMVDKLTKMVHLAPTTKKCTARQAAVLFIQHWYQFHGIPERIISDRDAKFISRFWRTFTRKLGIDHRYSTSFHPQTDGQTERMNRVVEEVLRHFINKDNTDWEELLPMVAFAINNAKSAATGETPFFLQTGTHPRTMTTAFVPTETLPTLDKVFHDLRDTLEQVKKLYKAAQDRQKAYADTKRQDHTFQDGAQVLFSTKNLKVKEGVRKLQPRYIGPFTIVKMVGKNAAKLDFPSTYKIHPVVHVSLLKPYRSDGSFRPLPPAPESIGGHQYYKVERILSHRTRTSGRKTIHEYLIKWLGYDDTHNSWEPEKNITTDLLDDYHGTHPLQNLN
jgi:hypothetical protein